MNVNESTLRIRCLQQSLSTCTLQLGEVFKLKLSRGEADTTALEMALEYSADLNLELQKLLYYVTRDKVSAQ